MDLGLGMVPAGLQFDGTGVLLEHLVQVESSGDPVAVFFSLQCLSHPTRSPTFLEGGPIYISLQNLVRIILRTSQHNTGRVQIMAHIGMGKMKEFVTVSWIPNF